MAGYENFPARQRARRRRRNRKDASRAKIGRECRVEPFGHRECSLTDGHSQDFTILPKINVLPGGVNKRPVAFELVFQCHADVHGSECVAENALCDFFHSMLCTADVICRELQD